MYSHNLKNKFAKKIEEIQDNFLKVFCKIFLACERPLYITRFKQIKPYRTQTN